MQPLLNDEYLDIDWLFAKKLLPKVDFPDNRLTLLAHLLRFSREGHMCMPLSQLPPHLVEVIPTLPEALFEKYLVQERGSLYLKRNWECEKRFLFHLKRIRDQSPEIPVQLHDLEKSQLNAEQKAALIKAASQTLTLITGGPGTGKTYTASQLIRSMMEQGVKTVAVSAPTGKATANLRIALGPLGEKCTVKTLHSLLKNEKVFADLLVVDEGSMIDAELMATLFSAVIDGARLVILGDADQLPPVESGHFFADLSHQKELVASLKNCLRTELEEIIALAVKVQRGDAIPYKPLPPTQELIEKIKKQNLHVLTPLRKGPYGVDHLNHLLFLENQKKGSLKVPIMIRVNAPTLDLYNGDLGLWDLSTKRVTFSGGRQFSEAVLPSYEYGYVLSVHKSQGSEYDRVLILLPKGSESFGREMLYTAVTRAKKSVEILAEPGVLEQILAQQSRRSSGLYTNS